VHDFFLPSDERLIGMAEWMRMMANQTTASLNVRRKRSVSPQKASCRAFRACSNSFEQALSA